MFHNDALDGFRFRSTLGADPTVVFLGTMRDLACLVQGLFKVPFRVNFSILGDMDGHIKVSPAMVRTDMQSDLIIHFTSLLSSA